jgi:hypothetical protein
MTEDKQPPQSQLEPKSDDTTPAKASPGMAQVGTQRVPRPDKVRDRSIPDDIDE